jgi:hypothetical protein
MTGIGGLRIVHNVVEKLSLMLIKYDNIRVSKRVLAGDQRYK